MSIHHCMVRMTQDRLTARDWTDKGLKVLADSGFMALKADGMAKALGVSRGSFYWHFADVPAFHAAILDRWREVAFTEIVGELETTQHDPLRLLLTRAISGGARLERAIRAWATADPRARDAVEAIDAQRLDYLRRLILRSNVSAEHASARAWILHWTYLGHIVSANRPSKAALARLIDELATMATARG